MLFLSTTFKETPWGLKGLAHRGCLLSVQWMHSYKFNIWFFLLTDFANRLRDNAQFLFWCRFLAGKTCFHNCAVMKHFLAQKCFLIFTVWRVCLFKLVKVGMLENSVLWRVSACTCSVLSEIYFQHNQSHVLICVHDEKSCKDKTSPSFLYSVVYSLYLPGLMSPSLKLKDKRQLAFSLINTKKILKMSGIKCLSIEKRKASYNKKPFCFLITYFHPDSDNQTAVNNHTNRGLELIQV